MPPNIHTETMMDVHPTRGLDIKSRPIIKCNAKKTEIKKTKIPHKKIILNGAALKEVTAFTK